MRKFGKSKRDKSADIIVSLNQSKSAVFLDDFKIIVSKKVREVMEKINSIHQFKPLEFSIFIKGTFDWEKHEILVKDDYFIPKQLVSSSAIDYEEDSVDFNGIIHKHPSGCTSFSKTDNEYINPNFSFSIIWVDGRWADARVNLNSDRGRIKMDAKAVDIRSEETDELTLLAKTKIIPNPVQLPTYPGFGLGQHITSDFRGLNSKYTQPSKKFNPSWDNSRMQGLHVDAEGEDSEIMSLEDYALMGELDNIE